MKLINEIVLVLLTIVTFEVNAQILPLDSIFKAIDNNQPELKKHDAIIKAYDAYADGAKALDAPQVGAGFFMTPYNTQMWRSDVMTGNPGMGSFMFSAQQMITNPRKLNTNANYMQSMSSVERQMKNATRNELYSMAKMSYYNWLVLKKKLQVLMESEILLVYIIKSAELRYTYGIDKLNAYYKAKAMLGDIQNTKLMTDIEIKEQRINLNTLMKRNKEFVFDIDTSYLVKDYEKVAFDTSGISRNRSDYKVFEQNISLLKTKQLYERSKRMPDFGIRYDHMLPFGDQPQQFSLMAMITIPIAPWSSKMYRSAVKGLAFEIESVRNQQLSFINQTSGTLERLKAKIKNKKQQVDLYDKTILPSLKGNYETTLLAYEQNTQELFVALDAWQNLKLAQLGYLDLLKELLMLQVEYEKQLEI